MVVGLVGGALGVLLSLIGMFGAGLLLGGFGAGIVFIALLLNAGGLAGAIMVRNNLLTGSIVMLVCGALLIFFGMWWITMLMVVAGILGLVANSEEAKPGTPAPGA